MNAFDQLSRRAQPGPAARSDPWCRRGGFLAPGCHRRRGSGKTNDPPSLAGPLRLLVDGWPGGYRGRRSWSGLRSRPRGHGGDEDVRSRRLVSERAMRAHRIEVAPPAFDDDLRPGEGVEDFAVEQLVPKPCIERRLQAHPSSSGTHGSLSSGLISCCSPARPIGATRPNSAMCPRIVLDSWMRWNIQVSRTLCSTITLCCSGLFTSTKSIIGRVTASQIASASAASFFCRFTFGFI